MKATFCEFCPRDGGDCPVCASLEVGNETWPGLDGPKTAPVPVRRPIPTRRDMRPAPSLPLYLAVAACVIAATVSVFFLVGTVYLLK